MGALRDRMVREMQLREFSASTQTLYLATLTDLARYHHRAPDTLDGTQVQDYLLYLTRARHLAWSSVSVAASAIRFFYTQTLHRPEIALAIPPRRKPRRLPHILSVEEIERLLSSPRHPTHRVLLMTTYAAGLRVSEVVRLQRTDLDRERLMIRVEQGKRRKDRYTILSPRLLTELDRYGAGRCLTRWLFPARTGEQPMSTSTAQHIFEAAKARALTVLARHRVDSFDWFKLGLVLVLSWCVIQGYGWARAYIIFSLLVGGVLFILGPLVKRQLIGLIVVVPFSAAFIASALVLWRSKSVEAYFARQARLRDGPLTIKGTDGV